MYTKGDQKVLQLGYKKLTYHITHAVIFWHILMQYQCMFSIFVLSCLCPENRILCFDSQTMPSQRSSVIHRLQVRFHEDGSSDFLLGNNYWEPSLDCRQDGLVEQTHSCRELAEQTMTCALVHCHEEVKLLIDNFCHCFCLMTSSHLNVGSA